jgi:tetratricopeptide (TPR) repeat protein
MKIFVLTLLTSVFIFSTFSLKGQSLKAYEQKAMEAYASRDYAAALAYHRVLLEIDSQRVDALFMSGESARHLRAFEIAEKYLSKIPDSLKTGFYASADFRLASVKKGLEKYDEAIVFYKKYIATHADTNTVFLERAKEELEFCEWAMELRQNPASIEVIHLDTNVNTYYSDFAPLRFADKLYYTSAYQEDTASAPVLRIYSVIQDQNRALIPENEAEKGIHTSHVALTPDGKRMYYTICRDKEYLYEYQCEIWYREKTYEGQWDRPRKLPDHINLKGFTATQPSNGRDKSLGKEVLFFVSDRPGGKGNMDIWCSVIEADGQFGQPFPLPFNTQQDDITPYFHMQSQTLFFSSGGLRNLGGYDIFRSKKTGKDTWAEPANMGYPLNSSYDDLYYTFHSGSRRAYFASNRPDALCAEPEKGCKCNDIFEARILVNLDAWTYNAIDSSDLRGARVELLDLSSGKVDTFLINDSGNKFSFPLELEKNYRITAIKKDFTTASAEVSTEGINYFASFERQLYLTPTVALVVRTFNAIDSLPLFDVTVTLDNRMNGKKLAAQTGPYSNQSNFPLDFGKSYTVSGAKPEYTADRADLSTEGMNEPDTIFQNLYLSPFLGLPLVLYFDNDMPRPVAYRPDTTTTFTYGETYGGYIARKPVFLENFTAGLNSHEREAAKAEIMDFFADSVEANYARLNAFADQLVAYLGAGNRLEILLSGYASPLANPEYNRRLTARRISSVVNHFRKYKNGLLSSYLESGQLVISRDPKGENHPHDNVSDKITDRRNSVFSPVASRLRKVTIKDIRALPDAYSPTE